MSNKLSKKRLNEILENIKTMSSTEIYVEINENENKSIESEFGKGVPVLNKEEIDTDDYGEEEYNVTSTTYDVSILEYAIYNSFLGKCRFKEIDGFKTISYGNLVGNNNVHYNGTFSHKDPWWFIVKYKELPCSIILQTFIYVNSSNQVCTELRLSFEEQITNVQLDKFISDFKKIAFNNSEFKGKCLNIRIQNGSFEGIKIFDIENFHSNVVLTETQDRFLTHFTERIKKGGTFRVLMAGAPGSGKTESIRNIIKGLTPKATFIIPDFKTSDDLMTILEACEIFEPGVIVIDDIDLYLGSRDKGGYTTMLGDFLTFFDGIKKRKISVLASTNNKELVDKAAERPGRFNITLDFGYLTDDQIEQVVNIHLPEKFRTKEIYDSLRGVDNKGQKRKVTGAFIANLASNLKEMYEENENWTDKDTEFLIRESYNGFYSSQISEERKSVGFK